MPVPDPPFPCGGPNQRACPPTTSGERIDGDLYFTLAQMHEYGQACYEKGRKDAERPTGAEGE